MPDVIGSLVFWQDEHGKLPVRLGTVEEYGHDKFQYTIRHGRLTSVVDAEKVKFVGVGNVVE